MNQLDNPNTHAWLAKEAESGPAHPYSFRLEGDRSGFGAISQGDWVLVVTPDGTALRVGHVVRIRSDLAATTFYFDRAHSFAAPLVLADLELSMPTGPAARLRSKDIEAALAHDGVSSPADVRLIEDADYVRDLLELATRDDLLGPAGGPEEYVIDMGVRDRYLVGKLAPRRPGEPDADQAKPAAAGDDAPVLEDVRDAPLHEPGAEFNRASGRVEPEEDDLD